MSGPKVTVDLEANVQKFGAAFSQAGNWVRGFLSLGALAGAAKAVIDFGSAINDAAAKAQVGAKWMQEVGHAAKMGGASFETVTTAVVAMRQAMGQALGGSAADMQAFAALGISLEDIRRLDPEAMFDRIAEAVAKGNGSLASTNAAIAILGRGGKELIPILADGFDEARAQAEELGLVLSDDTVEAMDDLGDRLDTITTKLKVFGAEILGNLTDLNNWAHLWELTKNTVSGSAKMLWSFATFDKELYSEAQKQLTDGNEAIVDDYIAVDEEGKASRKSARDRKRAARNRVPNTSFTTEKGKAMTAVDSLARIGGYLNGGPGGGMSGLLRTQNAALEQLKQIRSHIAEVASQRRKGNFVSW